MRRADRRVPAVAAVGSRRASRPTVVAAVRSRPRQALVAALTAPIAVLGMTLLLGALAACSSTSSGADPTSASSGTGPTGSTSSAGAGSSTVPSASASVRTELVTPTPAKTTTPPPGTDPTVVPTGQPTAVVDPALGPYVEIAKADLATRLGVAATGIEVVTAMTVTWPDPSLGCPQPGVSYPQTPVDGAMILLRVGDKDYGYRAGGDKKPFLCAP